jgi:hypothetical protein
MAVKFTSLTKHATLQFLPNISLGFEDADVEDYMIHAGFAVKTNDPPVHVYPKGEIEVDFDTRHNETGLTVGEISDANGDIDKAKATRAAKAKEEAKAAELEVQDGGTVAPADGASAPAKSK